MTIRYALFSVSLTVLVALFTTSCVKQTPNFPEKKPSKSIETTLEIRQLNGVIQQIPLEQYVRGSLLAEASFSGLDKKTKLRVAQVQAILARTYALANRRRHIKEGFNLCATTHCQVYRSLDSFSSEQIQLAHEAAETTSGLVVQFNKKTINAVFHSDCGGHTSNAQVVWSGTSPPYLQGVLDKFCHRERTSKWRFKVDEPTLRQALNKNTKTETGKQLESLVVTNRDIAGRVIEIEINGYHLKTVRGEELRAAIVKTFGTSSIKSTRFSVHRIGNNFVFEGQGFGHGVGLCQFGAMARASAGHSPHKILSHYYPGTNIEKIWFN